MASWDVSAVGRWLETAGFEDLVSRFENEQIDGEVLHRLTLEELQLLKIPLGRGKKLLDAVTELKAHQRMSQPRSTWSAGDAKRLPPLISPSSDMASACLCQVILLMGPPGTGKSTLGNRLAEKMGGEHFDLGEHLRSEGKSGQPQTMLLNFLGAAVEKGKKRAALGLGPHMAFINGFPRMMDGFEFWEELEKVVKPSLVLVFEAPDDVLKARVIDRARPDDQKSFEERLTFYRRQTDPVITAFHDTGRTRFIDATGSIEFVEASAIFHLQTAVLFACGQPEIYGKVCDEVVDLGLPYQVTCLDVAEVLGDSQVVVDKILSVVRERPGSVILLKGFPRTQEDLKAWRLVEVLMVLDFDSKMDFSGYFTRGFKDAGPATRNTVSQLIRSCQPLHVAVPFAATGLLRNWMDAARYIQWWDPSKFESFQPQYAGYLKDQVAKHKGMPSLYVRPSDSPPLDAWLFWLTHLLHAGSYETYCDKVLHRMVGPLPPPVSSGLTKTLERKKFAAVTGKMLLDSDALASAPLAFVDGLASLHNAGLFPMSDPRALCFGSSEPGSIANELMLLLALYYRRFLIVMGEAGEHSKAGPSAEMDWIWHAHTTHPAVYADDCRRLFGHVIPHIPCKRSDAPVGEEKDEGQVAMGQLNKLMRSKLQALATKEKAKLEKATLWPFRDSKLGAEDDIITLGCFIPGGDREWLSGKIRSVDASIGEALSRSLKEPLAWECPLSTAALQRDPDLVEVIVRLLSGETLLEKVMTRDTKIAEIERLLRSTGGEREDLKFFVDGAQLASTDTIGETDVVNGAVINMVRVKKPKPKPKPVAVVRAVSSDSDDWRCTCFTNACIFHVLKSGRQVSTKMQDLQEGDLVHTGSTELENRFRRVTRIWRCPVPKHKAFTVELRPGCRLTTGHPVQVAGHWRRPESCGKVEETQEPFVYTLELEGHVDTVLVGRDEKKAMMCAALGVYCGESFGWNLFTRKTRPCDSLSCKKCEVAVVPSLNFATVTPDMLEVKYAPY